MPAQGLSSSDPFSGYPEAAHALGLSCLPLLRQVPPLFAAVLLREIIAYDWKFPLERSSLEKQLHLLQALDKPALHTRLEGFAAIRLSPELLQADWIGNPAGFSEQLTAWLWSSGQMDRFRLAADAYAAWLAEVDPMPRPPRRRLAMIAIGGGATQATSPLFRKLRPQGLYLNNVQPVDGWTALVAAAEARALAAPGSYRHWLIAGGSPEPTPHLAQLSYAELAQPRARLLQTIQSAIDSGSMGPESLRTLIARLEPREIGLGGAHADATLERFKLALLTEGAGTQIFSTTFVQWAARECLRRAQPETLLLRYAPRQQMQTMNSMLRAGDPGTSAALDPAGSLTDADMGAYYTWINMNRLAGADQMSFLVWFEGHAQALAIAPGLPRGTTSNSALTIAGVLKLLA